MVRIQSTRKSRFKAALALTGLTQKEWAEGQAGISRGYLNMVLNGKMESDTLTQKIDAFIADIEAKVLAA